MLGPSWMNGAARASVPRDAAASPGHAQGKQRARGGLILLAILVCEQTLQRT
jgi:hypothetical protein